MVKCNNCRRDWKESEFRSKFPKRKTLTKKCRKCRDVASRSDVNPTTKKGKCKAFWEQWKASHSCPCGITDTRLLEADHLSEKVKACSDYKWWSHHGGVPAMERELATCQCLCGFCHRLKTKAERGTQKQPHILAKRAIINEEKLRRGGCLHCKRAVTMETMCAFDLDHRVRVDKKDRVSQMVYKSWPYFNKHAKNEWETCDLLCVNCHKIKTINEKL